MGARQSKQTAADHKAAEWHARLGTRSISLKTLEEFSAWRLDRANDAAYRRIESQWGDAVRLADDPDILAALKAAQSTGPKRRRKRRTYGALGVALATSVFAVSYVYWQGRGNYETQIGESRVVELADGSSIRLDTASRIKVRYSQNRRSIELIDGQAMFDVAHDAQRPFVVETREASVTAVGTVFEVRRVNGDTRIVLVQGAVDVAAHEGPASPKRMAPNQEARVRRDDTKVATVDALAATSWTEGKLTFHDTPLRDAVAEVNRYLEAPIVLEADGVANTPVNGVFRSGDRDAFVSATAGLLGLRAVEGKDGSIRLLGSRS